MNKSLKKRLVLHRETLRYLAQAGLEGVRGGSVVSLPNCLPGSSVAQICSQDGCTGPNSVCECEI